MSLYDLLGKRVFFRSRWGESTHTFSGVVISLSTITPDAHVIYAFVQEDGWAKPRPVRVDRLGYRSQRKAA